MNAQWRYVLAGMILSWTLGICGADRFYRGQVGLGVLKLITFGAFGVWYLVDAAIWTYQFGKLSKA